MNSVFITARFNNDSFDEYLGPTTVQFGTKCINVSDIPETTIKNIPMKYNVGVKIMKEKKVIDSHGIYIFIKNNVHVTDALALEKLEHIFATENVDIVGVMGVRCVNRGRDLYDYDNKPVNGIMHKVVTTSADGTTDNVGEHICYCNGYFTDVVGIDDSMIAIRGSYLLENEDIFDVNDNQGYGLSLVLDSRAKGVSVACADILVLSEDNTNISHNIVGDIVDRFNIDMPVSITSSFDKRLNIDIEV